MVGSEPDTLHWCHNNRKSHRQTQDGPDPDPDLDLGLHNPNREDSCTEHLGNCSEVKEGRRREDNLVVRACFAQCSVSVAYHPHVHRVQSARYKEHYHAVEEVLDGAYPLVLLLALSCCVLEAQSFRLRIHRAAVHNQVQEARGVQEEVHAVDRGTPDHDVVAGVLEGDSKVLHTHWGGASVQVLVVDRNHLDPVVLLLILQTD